MNLKFEIFLLGNVLKSCKSRRYCEDSRVMTRNSGKFTCTATNTEGNTTDQFKYDVHFKQGESSVENRYRCIHLSVMNG